MKVHKYHNELVQYARNRETCGLPNSKEIQKRYLFSKIRTDGLISLMEVAIKSATIPFLATLTYVAITNGLEHIGTDIPDRFKFPLLATTSCSGLLASFNMIYNHCYNRGPTLHQRITQTADLQRNPQKRSDDAIEKGLTLEELW